MARETQPTLELTLEVNPDLLLRRYEKPDHDGVERIVGSIPPRIQAMFDGYNSSEPTS